MTEPRKLRVFLCHASQDKPVVRELYQRLLAEGWIDPWLDTKKLLPGQDWRTLIEDAIESSDVIVFCLSKGSVNKEGFVQKELRYAREIALEKPDGTIFLIPLRLEICDVPRGLRFLQWVDYFDENKTQNYNYLVASLNTRYNQISIDETSSISGGFSRGFEVEENQSVDTVEINTNRGTSKNFSEHLMLAAQDTTYLLDQELDIEMSINISFEEAAFGVEKIINFSRYETCKICDGSGVVKTSTCDDCNGNGTYLRELKKKFEIPAGILSGTVVRLKQEGHTGNRGASKGNVYIVITIIPHPIYNLNEMRDITLIFPVPNQLIVRGGTIQVPLLGKGRYDEIAIRPNTPNHKKFIMKGEGFPRLRSSGHGDLIVVLEIFEPRHASDEIRNILKEINRLNGNAFASYRFNL